MTEERFWTLIGRMDIKYNTDAEGVERIDELEEPLSKESIKDIICFNEILSDKAEELRAKEHLLDAVFYEFGIGCSDSGFENFLMWVISRGKSFFQDTLNGQQELRRFLENTEDKRCPEFEIIFGLWEDAFEKKKKRFKESGDTELAEDRMLLLMYEDEDLYKIRELIEVS